MLKKIVAIVTLGVGVLTSALFGTATASAAGMQEPIAAVSTVDTGAPGDSDDPSSCRHSWKKCDVLPTISNPNISW